MKKSIILPFLIFVSFISYGQVHKNLDEIKVSPPKFTGTSVQKELTYESIERYLAKVVQDQVLTADVRDEGTVVVQFTVNASGALSDLRVINSVSPFLDNKVTEALQHTEGLWKPGANNDELVSMEKEVAISFRYKESPDFVEKAQWYFKKGAKKMFIKEKPDLALKYFNHGVTLLPNSKPLLAARGLAKYELGDESGACKDWNRVKNLGGVESDGFLKNFCQATGYAEMLSITQEK